MMKSTSTQAVKRFTHNSPAIPEPPQRGSKVTKDFTRKEYMASHVHLVDADPEERFKLYRNYYAQFVTENIKNHVREVFGEKIKVSTNKHFNDIPLRLWYVLCPQYRTHVSSVNKRLTGTAHYTMSDAVSMLKEAAEQIREEAK